MTLRPPLRPPVPLRGDPGSGADAGRPLPHRRPLGTTDNAREFALAFGGSGADTRAEGEKVYGGYLWRQFGVEAGNHDLGTYAARTGSAKFDDFLVPAFTVSGVLAVPMGANFCFNGRLSIAFTQADYRCYLGCADIGWRITHSLSLRADYESIRPVSHGVGLIRAESRYQALSVSLQADFRAPGRLERN
ncbi:MAG: hypothetical protein OEO84_08995 [Betaproteobacteria bacterium]|nr:hypothetical protein [Betaproteobacteria bacterium]